MWELFIIPNKPEINEWPNDIRIKIIGSGKVGPGEKRDIGAQKASGNILVFLDDDSYPESNLLEVAIKYFKDSNIIALGGPGITPNDDGFWQKVSSAVFLSKFTGGSPERYLPIGKAREIDDWPSVNLMVRKDIFLSVGGFDCQYWPGEDTKLCLKLLKTGKKLIYVPEMIVWHHRRPGLISHLRQIGAYGLHRGFFARHYPETSFRLKYFAPPLFSIFVLLTIFMDTLPIKIQFIYKIIWLIYGLGLLIGFMQILRHERFLITLIATGFYIPLTHFYYGIQFRRGFFKKELVSKLR